MLAGNVMQQPQLAEVQFLQSKYLLDKSELVLSFLWLHPVAHQNSDLKKSIMLHSLCNCYIWVTFIEICTGRSMRHYLQGESKLHGMQGISFLRVVELHFWWHNACQLHSPSSDVLHIETQAWLTLKESGRLDRQLFTSATWRRDESCPLWESKGYISDECYLEGDEKLCMISFLVRAILEILCQAWHSHIISAMEVSER